MRSKRFATVAAVGAMLAISIAGCGGSGSTDSRSAGEKSGGAAPPSVLRLGTVEDKTSPYADEVKKFAEGVAKRSKGAIKVDVVWEAPGPFTGESETKIAAMVRDGKIDLAVVPTRVWDQLKVTTMQALQAPFLVDNLGLLNAIAKSDLAGAMLSGLDAVGVKGMAIWPESLRHPVGFAAPLLTAADFDGAKLRVPVSDASYRLAAAIGAKHVDPEDWKAATEAGELDGAESAFVWADGLQLAGTFTGNVTFYPKANTIVANGKRFESLSPEQRNLLQQVATDTIAYVVKTNATEHDLAVGYCKAGGSVAIAQDRDVADLAARAAPVFTALEKDAETERLIEAIGALKHQTKTDPAAAPAACQPDKKAATGSDTFPAGVYRAKFTGSGGKTLVATMTFADGAWRGTDDTGDGDCTGTYVVVSGRIRITTPSDRVLSCGNPPNFMFFDAAWTFKNGELRFVDIKSDPNAVHDFGSEPWTAIG